MSFWNGASRPESRAGGKPMRIFSRRLGAGSAVFVLVTALAACSSSNNASPTTPAGRAPPVSISVSDLTVDFSAMKKLTALASQGKGMGGVLLPGTTTAHRYVQDDAPPLTKAF